MSARKPLGIIPRLLMALAVAFAPLGTSLAQAQALTAQNVATLGKGVVRLNFIGALPASVTYSRTGVATAYTAAGGVTSFAANAAQVTDRGLLLEATRANIVLRSRQIADAAWNKSSSTATDNAAAAPDGTVTASAFIPANGLNGADYRQSLTFSTATAYTISSVLKYNAALALPWVEVATTGGTTRRSYFNISTGTVGTVAAGATGAITPLANGYYRIALTYTTNATSGLLVISPRTTDASTAAVTGDGATPAFWVLENQKEVGSPASSPITTTTAAVTRGTPTVTVPVPAGRTRWRSVHYDGSTASGSGLTPGATFDIYAAIVTGAGKGGLGQELRRLEFLP